MHQMETRMDGNDSALAFSESRDRFGQLGLLYLFSLKFQQMPLAVAEHFQ